MIRPMLTLTLLMVGMAAGLAGAGPATADQATPPPPAGAGGTDWPMSRGDAARTGAVAGAGPRVDPAVAWRASLLPCCLTAEAPIVAGGLVFFIGTDEPLVALDAATGAERWRADVGFAISGDPDGALNAAAAGGVLYVAGTEGEASYDHLPPGALYALEAATGRELWRHSFGEEVNLTPPAVAGGMVYLTVGGFGSAVVAFDAESGAERWRVPLADPEYVSGALSVADGTVFAGASVVRSPGDLLIALDAATGTERWRITLDGVLVAAAAVAEGTAYLRTASLDGSSPGRLIAVDAASGAERWRAEVGEGYSAPAVADGLVYAGVDWTPSTPASLRAFDATTGTERWRAEGAAGTPAVAGGLVYGTAIRGDARTGPMPDGLVALDAASGARVWHLGAIGRAVTEPVVADGMIFATDGEGVVAVAEGAARGTAAPTIALEQAEAACQATAAGEDPPGLYVAQADGSGATCIGLGFDPTWSPDGARLAFADGATGQAIRVVEADGSGETLVQVVPMIFGPVAWAPTGARFAFVSEEELVVVGLDGSVLATVPLPFFSPNPADPAQAAVGPAFARPAWSPDGQRLAFADYDRTDGGGVGTEIFAVAADGSGKAQLTDFPAGTVPYDPADPNGPRFAVAVASSPAWSPDGGRVAFALQEGTPGAEVGVGVVDADGSGQTVVADVPPFSGPAWSPDGTTLLFGSWRGAVADVWVVGADGSGLTNLTATHDGQAADPVWSPDGARIAFASGGDIWVMNADGSDQRRLTGTTLDDTAPSWSPDGTRIAFQALAPYSD